MLARAFATEPEVFLLDEPTADLDPAASHAIMRLLRATADAGRTVVVVLHALDLALRYAHRVVVLAGRAGDRRPARRPGAARRGGRCRSACRSAPIRRRGCCRHAESPRQRFVGRPPVIASACTLRCSSACCCGSASAATRRRAGSAAARSNWSWWSNRARHADSRRRARPRPRCRTTAARPGTPAAALEPAAPAGAGASRGGPAAAAAAVRRPPRRRRPTAPPPAQLPHEPQPGRRRRSTCGGNNSETNAIVMPARSVIPASVDRQVPQQGAGLSRGGGAPRRTGRGDPADPCLAGGSAGRRGCRAELRLSRCSTGRRATR